VTSFSAPTSSTPRPAPPSSSTPDELNSNGGIKPFIGAGIGYGWLKNTASKSALASDVFRRSPLRDQRERRLHADRPPCTSLYNVDFANVVGENNRQVNSFKGVAGLRFNF
jgi:opacity protein-like surface antigen